MGSRLGWRWGGVLVATAMLGAGLASPTAAATYTFDLEMNTPCAAGKGPVNTELTIQLRKADGTKLDQMSVTADSQGRWGGCFSSATVRSGRKIRATDGETGRTFTIPALTVRTDRGDDTVRGKAPAGSSVRIRIYDCHSDPMGPAGCPKVVSLLRTASSRGTYAVDVSSRYNARGSDGAGVVATLPSGDRLFGGAPFPYFSAEPGKAVVGGWVNSRASTTLTLDETAKGTTLLTTSTTADIRGSFEFTTVPHDIVAGNVVRLSFESDARVIIPDPVGIQYGQSGQTVIDVHCLPNRPVWIWWTNLGGPALEVTADENGLASLDVVAEGHTGLTQGNTFGAECITRAGDRLRLSGQVPIDA